MPLKVGKTYNIPNVGKVRIEDATVKGKKKSAVRLSDGKRVNWGQKGESVQPGTEPGNNYCSRSLNLNEYGFNANTLARIDWHCKGSKSIDSLTVKEA
jgi:hypothetical protein